MYKGFQITFKRSNITHATFNNISNDICKNDYGNNYYAYSNENNNIKNNNTSKTWEKFTFQFAGNCLELAASGILNQIPCNMTFSCGCPETFFFSSEFYKCMFNFQIYTPNRNNFKMIIICE